MKILIHVLCIFVYAFIIILLKEFGITLGGIPTFLLFAGTIWISRSLCQTWDERQRKAFVDSAKNNNSAGLVVFNGQRPREADFGISKKNPLCTTSSDNTDSYLSRLRTSDGRKFTWQHIGETRADCNGAIDIGMEMYQLYLDGVAFKVLYFATNAGNSTAAPHGMELHQYVDNEPLVTSLPVVEKEETYTPVKRPATEEKQVARLNQQKPRGDHEKKKYYKFSGNLIDIETKKCSNYGKQHFKGIRINKTVVTAITLVILVVGVSAFAVVQYLNVLKLQDQITLLEDENLTIKLQVDSKEKEIKELQSRIQKIESDMGIFSNQATSIGEQRVAIFNPSSKIYHDGDCYESLKFKYGLIKNCYYIDISLAKQLGYKACSQCK